MPHWQTSLLWEEMVVNSGKRRILIAGILTALSLTALLTYEIRPVAHAAEGDEIEYTFGRPIQNDEKTYEWYRGTHAAEAAKRYGVDPAAVGDGMDTWHWWVSVSTTPDLGGNSRYAQTRRLASL